MKQDMTFQNFHGLLVFYTTIINDDGPKRCFITKHLMIYISCGVFSVWLHSFLYTALIYILTTPLFFFSSGWTRGNRGDRCSRSSLGLLTVWRHCKLSIDWFLSESLLLFLDDTTRLPSLLIKFLKILFCPVSLVKDILRIVPIKT